MTSDATEESGESRNSAFQVTLWSQVLAAGSDSAESPPALEELCRRYWYPIYAFLRRSGHDAESALDLSQGFFQYVLQRDLIMKANPGRGRFRSFLLGILKNFVRDERDREQTLRRGGGAQVLSIDEETAEGRYQYEPSTITNPEILLDRRWALQVIEHALERLRVEYEHAQKPELFDELQPYLTDEDPGSYAELAQRLTINEGTARTRVCRFRERFRFLLRSVIADTVSDPALVDLELEHLQASLRAD